MLFVEYRVISPQLPPSSPESQPRKLWRVGREFLRFEDVPNPQTNVHGLIIVDEPDIWIIDRKKGQGQHSVDPGPNYVIHFPIFPNEQSDQLRQLEFGRELQFFHEHGAKELPSQVVEGIDCRRLRLKFDDREVTLFLKSDNTPLQLAVQSARNAYAVRFLKYDANQKPDMTLFKVPSGTQVSEPKN
jgi:hypothetical protein